MVVGYHYVNADSYFILAKPAPVPVEDVFDVYYGPGGLPDSGEAKEA